MKKFLLSVVAVSFGAGAFWLFAPAHIKDKAYGVLTFATPERMCFREHLDYFSDPDTAYLADSYIWTKEDEIRNGSYDMAPFKNTDQIIKVEVRAKNKFGAYAETYVTCAMFGSAGVVALRK